VSALEHKSRNGEQVETKHLFHMTRAINRRSIRVREDNFTREIVDELLHQLDPESDLWAQIRYNREQRDEVMTGQQIDLDLWERFMRGQGFTSAADLPQTTTQGGGQSHPPQGGGETAPQRGGGGSAPMATSGQVNLINTLISESQAANKEWITICGTLGIDKPGQLTKNNASKTIDKLKAAAGWPDKPQGGQQRQL